MEGVGKGATVGQTTTQGSKGLELRTKDFSRNTILTISLPLTSHPEDDLMMPVSQGGQHIGKMLQVHKLAFENSCFWFSVLVQWTLFQWLLLSLLHRTENR